MSKSGERRCGLSHCKPDKVCYLQDEVLNQVEHGGLDAGELEAYLGRVRELVGKCGRPEDLQGALDKADARLSQLRETTQE